MMGDAMVSCAWNILGGNHRLNTKPSEVHSGWERVRIVSWGDHLRTAVDTGIGGWKVGPRMRTHPLDCVPLCGAGASSRGAWRGGWRRCPWTLTGRPAARRSSRHSIPRPNRNANGPFFKIGFFLSPSISISFCVKQIFAQFLQCVSPFCT